MGEIVKLDKLGSENGTTKMKSLLKSVGGVSELPESKIMIDTAALGGKTGQKLSVDPTGSATVEREEATEKEHDTVVNRLMGLFKGKTGKTLLFIVGGYFVWRYLQRT